MKCIKEKPGYNETKPRHYTITKLPQCFDVYSYYNGSSEELRVLQYEGDNTSVTIPSTLNNKTVSKISSYFCTFSYPEIKSITLPNTIKTIEAYAFSGNRGLEKINIPDSVETIGKAPFRLSHINASGITVGNKYSIKNDALLGDGGKTYIQALYSDTNSKYTVPEGVTNINPEAFSIESASSVVLPSTLKTVNSKAFTNSYVKSVDVPATVTTIDSEAFSGARLLNTVIIEKGVKTIGEKAFANCTNLRVLRIPSSVTSISANIFDGISDTSNITIYGVKATTAETFANNNNIRFVAGTKYELDQSMEERGNYIFTYNGKSQTPKIDIVFNGNKLAKNTDYTITYKQSTVNASNATNGITYVVKGIGNYGGEFENKYFINKAYWDFDLIVPDVEFGTPVTPQITNGLQYDSLWYRPAGETKYWYSGLPTKLGEYEYEARINEDDNHYSTSKRTTNKITGTPLKSISIKGDNRVQKNGSTVLEVVLNPNNASVDKSNVRWESSNTEIATVHGYTGRVTGVKNGTVTITAKLEDKTATYKVTVFTPVNLSQVKSAIANTDKEYRAKPITRCMNLSYNGTKLVEGTDYTVTYYNNVNPGTATIYVTGKGNYTGTITSTFKIVKQNLANVTKRIANSDKPYTGKAVTRYIELKNNGTLMKAGTDYTVTYTNNVNPGTATITITGKGNYTGTITSTFKIVKQNLANVTKRIANSDKEYTGKPITRYIELTYNGATLKAGTDYTVAYSNNVNPGTATITITGKGNYTGTITSTFKIVKTPKKDLSLVKARIANSDKEYTGKAITRYIELKDNDSVLQAGTDYTVTYKNNVNVGTATITITGKGNYTGTITSTFKIVPKN